MSDERGVMLSDVMRDVTLQQVTPGAGEGALGTWRVLTDPGHRARDNRVIKYGPRPTCKPWLAGVDMSQHLSLASCGKAVGVKAKVRTGFGKPDRPGSQGGLRKRELWWN